MNRSALVLSLVGCCLAACNSQGLVADSTARTRSGTATNPSAAPSEQVVLAGTFERVAKPVTGRAEIIRRDSQYQLVLTDVTVATDATVRVYLVGHDRASSTVLVESAELKYDMAELERGVSRQVIDLPSEPDPSLRSVVLYSPQFGVNLGFAPMRGGLPTFRQP